MKRLTQSERGRIFNDNVRRRLVQARISRGMTMSLLADISGIPLKRLELYFDRSQGLSIPLQTAYIICIVLQIRLRDLVKRAAPITRRRKPKPKPEPLLPRRKINGVQAAPWEERDHLIAPEPPPDAKEFGWRAKCKPIPSRSERLRLKSKSNLENAGDDDESTS